MADLERELTRALGPVKAPGGLWAAIQRPQEVRAVKPSFDWALWPAAALVLMLTLAGVLRSHTLDLPAPTPIEATASNCHTPVYAVKDVRMNAHAGCLACHFSVPGTMIMSLP